MSGQLARGRTVSAFDQAFAIVIGEEGGYVHNPADPGGETKFGISKRAYPLIDIAALTLERAKAIYHADFWAKIDGDALPPPLALLVFDAAVNNGVGRAVGWLQTALGTLADGKMGPTTLAAITAHHGSGAKVAAEFQAQRINFMAGLPTWRTFGMGWSRRLAALPYSSIGMQA